MGEVLRITTDRTVDEKGVVLSETRQENVVTIRKMEDEPQYVKMYIEDLGKILGLQDGHRRVLMLVAGSVDYEGIVSLAIGRKARIAATLDCSIKSVDNAITEFVKQGLMRRIERGEYELNPNYFARGAWREIRERRQAFTMSINYTARGRVVTTRALTAQEAAKAEKDALAASQQGLPF